MVGAPAFPGVVVRTVGALYLSGDLFHVKSAVSGVEARHKWFETWNHAGH